MLFKLTLEVFPNSRNPCLTSSGISPKIERTIEVDFGVAKIRRNAVMARVSLKKVNAIQYPALFVVCGRTWPL